MDREAPEVLDRSEASVDLSHDVDHGAQVIVARGVGLMSKADGSMSGLLLEGAVPLRALERDRRPVSRQSPERMAR